MSNWIIIPDVHGRKFWRAAVQGHEEDKIIFLGDYVDPYDWEEILASEAFKELQDIIAFKKEHPDNVVLLLGNHDMGYLDREICCCRMDFYREKQIGDLFRENLDLESLDTGPSDWPGFTADSRILQFLLYKLDAVPGVGEDLVGIGLHCFDRNVREAALDVVEAWQLRGYAHDQELEERYLDLQKKENDPELRERLTQKKKLLN